VANLRPIKDHASLVRATAILAPRHPNLHLVMVGSGECEPSLRQLVNELHLEDRVRFPGTRTDALSFFGLFDIAVLCSLAEGFPNSLVEAMASGTPAIATAVGGNRDAIVDGESGLLVPPGDPVRLAAAIERLLLDAPLRALMGVRARERAQERYSAQGALTALQDNYEHLLGPRRSRATLHR